MLQKNKTTVSFAALMKARARQFGRDESGAIIVMTILFLTLMMIMGGMAVDFMRFESRRTMLQSVADRAVLAAAELNQDKDAGAVVVDYFKKAGFDGTIIGTPDVISTADFSSVGVTARYEMDSIYLKMLGIEKLSAPAAATAIEGVANIEISLVVDISGSMRNDVVPADGSASTQTKIEALRAAATTFSTTVLDPKYVDKISLSLVPYSEHVNAGPDLMAELPVTKLHDWSHCVEFEASEFNTSTITDAGSYEQMQHFQWNSAVVDGAYANEVVNTVCPQYDFERITPLSQDLTALNLQISQLQPRAGTSIFLGLKWGLALLDPSMETAVNGLVSSGVIDNAFSGRPEAYPIDGIATDTQKVIVLMTDGQNDNSYRLKDGYYENENHYAHWATNNFWYYWSRELGYSSWSALAEQKFDNAIGNTYMQQLCTLAKANEVIIYAVAVEATTDGQQQMAQCASSNAHFFNASGDDLEAIFSAIATQITELRLSL